MLFEFSRLWSVAYEQTCYVVLSPSACSWQFLGVRTIFTTKKSLVSFMKTWKPGEGGQVMSIFRTRSAPVLVLFLVSLVI